MDIGQILLIVFAVIYTNHIFKFLFNKKNRMSMQIANKKLDEYRTKSIKTIEEQKEFINIKYPKLIGTFKFSWKSILSILFMLVKFIILFKVWSYFLFEFLNLNFKIWQSLLLIIVLSYLINYILRKFNLQKSGLNDVINVGGKK